MQLSSKTAAVVVVLVAFCAGALLGVAADRFYIFRNGPPRPPRVMTKRIVDHLTSELSLNKAQHDAVAAIVERHRLRMDAISDSMRPQMQKEIEAANAEIEQQLNADQKEKFAKLRMKMHQRRSRR